MTRPAILCLTLAACASAQTPQPAPQVAERPVQVEAPPPARRGPLAQRGCDTQGGIQVEGQLGTIAVENVRRVVRDANDGLAQCFHARVEALPVLAGRVELKLRVGPDGGVRWAAPLRTSMGDHEVEACMIERARALTFQAPCGGEAEVSTAIELDGGPDARPAVPWPAARVAPMLRQRRTQLAACRGAHRGAMTVTGYVARDGSVAGAGANAGDPEGLAVRECVLREVRRWRLPSPGSWYARFTFELP